MANAKGFTGARAALGGNMGLLEDALVSNGYATALYSGDPVAISTNGYAVRAATADTVVGIFRGARWIDPTSKKYTTQNYLPASTSSYSQLDGYSTPIATIETVQDKSFFITCNATVTQGLVGQYAACSANAGSTFTGLSGYVLDVASCTTATSTNVMVQIKSFPNFVENPTYTTAGGAATNQNSANPVVEVVFLRTRSNIV